MPGSPSEGVCWEVGGYRLWSSRPSDKLRGTNPDCIPSRLRDMLMKCLSGMIQVGVVFMKWKMNYSWLWLALYSFSWANVETGRGIGLQLS